MSDLTTAFQSPPALEYAPRPSAPRRWARRIRRWWPVALLLICIVLSVLHGPRAWRHWKILRLQEACLTAELPQDRPTYALGAPAVQARSSYPTEYQTDPFQGEARIDSRWAAFSSELGLIPPSSTLATGFPLSTHFLHERFTPSGARRLVVLEGRFVTIIEPGRWFRRPRVIRREAVNDDDEDGGNALMPLVHMSGDDFDSRAGIADPNDRSRFVISFTTKQGLRAAEEYRLDDNDQLVKRLLDPAGVRVRIKQLRDRAATQPAGSP